MSTATASAYRANLLFRLLAFLDNTGTQSFVLNKEVGEDGRFLRPDEVFAESTAIAALLNASLRALRANVHRLFSDAEEQQALLGAIGTGVVGQQQATSTPDLTARASGPSTHSSYANTDAVEVEHPQDSEKEGLSCDTSNDAPTRTQASLSSQLPIDTTWSYLVCHPVSLLHYAEQVEDELPVHLLLRLREVLGVIPSASLDKTEKGVAAAATTFSTTPFAEQMLIDGLDEWLRSCPVDEVKRIVLACGVQPAVLASAFEQQQRVEEEAEQHQQEFSGKATPVFSSTSAKKSPELPDSLVDFVVDVVFPVSSMSPCFSPSSTVATQSTISTTAEGLQDWLLLSYGKNHETIEIGEEEEDEEGRDGGDSNSEAEHASNGAGADGGDESGYPRKMPRSEGDRQRGSQKTVEEEEERDGLGTWQPEEGEEVLTADNIDRYLRECPQRIPREVLRETRKPISDAAITAFELEHHYTAAELRRFVKDEVGSMSVQEASATMGCPVSESQIAQAARATRKAQLVEWVLAVHRTQAGAA